MLSKCNHRICQRLHYRNRGVLNKQKKTSLKTEKTETVHRISQFNPLFLKSWNELGNIDPNPVSRHQEKKKGKFVKYIKVTL